MEEKSKENVKALEKALIILEMIKESKIPLGVNEISRQCKINLTTAFRILQTFKSKGWVYQNSEDKYIIGMKVSFVTDRNNFYLALKEIAYYTMARLSAKVSQAMNLIVRENEKCFILQQSRTDKIVDYVPPIGTVLPIYASAGGKVLLAELPEMLLEEILDMLDFKPLTKYTIIRRSVFLEELQKVKTLGYAIDEHESQEEGFCLAVPVRNRENEIIAALSFSGFIGTLNETEIKDCYLTLKEASEEITGNLYKYQ